MASFRRFWVKESRHSENTFAKKRYTSIVARVDLGSLLDSFIPLLGTKNFFSGGGGEGGSAPPDEKKSPWPRYKTRFCFLKVVKNTMIFG